MGHDHAARWLPATPEELMAGLQIPPVLKERKLTYQRQASGHCTNFNLNLTPESISKDTTTIGMDDRGGIFGEHLSENEVSTCFTLAAIYVNNLLSWLPI